MAGSYEVGSGHFAVIPSFKGFRRAVDREAKGAGESGARGFSRAMGKGGDVAGGLAGRGFARGFQKSSSVSGALKSVQREVRTAAAGVAKARLGEADAAGRVRVAEAQLAEARSKYAAGSSQVVRAEERLASVQRGHAESVSRLQAATGRLTQAQQVLASAQAGVGRSGRVWQQLGRDLSPIGSMLGNASRQLGIFYRTSKSLAPLRSVVDSVAMGWTRVTGAIKGLGPVVLRPLAGQVTDVAKRFGSWANDSLRRIPGVGRAMDGVGRAVRVAGTTFGALGKAGATVMKALGPVGSQIASSLGRGFQAAVTAAGRAASQIGSAFQGVLGGAVTAGVAGLVASLKGGFDRLASVETATAKMRGFGLATETVTDVMAQVKDSVQGTVYSVGEMGNAAAAAVLAGVKPGKQLDRYMGLLKNTATAAGAPLNEIQSIFGKIVANVGGPVTTELNQLTDRGIPAWTILAEKMGLSVKEVKDLASEGKITADVITEHLGGAMENMASEVGGTTVSSLQRMKSSFSRFGEALLQESFPGVKAVADAVRSVMDLAIALVGPMKEAFGLDQVGPAISKIEGLTEKVRAFTDLIKGDSAEGANAVNGIVNRVKELAPVLAIAAAAAIPLMGSFLSSLPVIGGLFAGLGPGLMAGLGPLLAGGGLIAMIGLEPDKFAGLVMGLVSSLSSGLSSLASTLPGLLAGVIPSMVSNLLANAPVLIEGMRQLFLSLVTTIVALIPSIVTAVTMLIPGIVTALAAAIPQLLTAGIQIVLGLVNGVLAALPEIIAAVVGMIPVLVTSLVSMIPQLVEGGLQLFLGLNEGLLAALPEIVTAIVGAIPVLVEGLLSAIPTLVMGALQLFLGLITGLLEALPQIVSALISAIPQLASALISQLPTIIVAAVQLFIGIVTAIVQATPQIITALLGLLGKLPGQVLSFVGRLVSVGGDLIAGLARGIAGAAGAVMDAIGSVVNGAIDWAKGLLGIKSPSRVFKQIGDFVGQGFAAGVTGSMSKVKSATDKLMKLVVQTGNRRAIASVRAANRQLVDNAKARESVANRLKDATKKLQDAVKLRSGWVDDVKSSIGDLGSVADRNSAGSMISNLEKRIKATAEFQSKLQALVKQGLDATSAKQLTDQFLSDGSLKGVDALTRGGATAVKRVADLQKQLASQAGKLGNATGDHFFKAGIDAAAGLVKGLESQSKALERAAKKISDALVKSVKKQLGIRSPSRRFRDEVGKELPRGVAEGVTDPVELARLRAATARLVEIPTVQAGRLAAAGAAAAARAETPVDVSLDGLVVEADMDGVPVRLAIRDEVGKAAGSGKKRRVRSRFGSR